MEVTVTSHPFLSIWGAVCGCFSSISHPSFISYQSLHWFLGFPSSPPTARLLPTIHHIQYCSYKLFSENPLKIAEEQLLL